MQALFSFAPALLKMSAHGGILIVLVLAAQWSCGRRLQPRWRYALWLLVLLRLALPWNIPSPFSLFNVLKLPSTAADAQSATGPAAMQNGSIPDDQTVPATVSSSGGHWLAWVWAAGAVCLAGCAGVNHYRIYRRVARQRPLIDEPTLNLLEDCKALMGVRTPVALIETLSIESPTLFGFVRPRLLLPAGLSSNFTRAELRHVFLHELAHIKRHDVLTGWVILGLQIIHWFNPLVWLAFHRLRADRELACDALALSYARPGENEAYGLTIVKLLEGFDQSVWAPSLAGILENKQLMKERISMIAKFKTTNNWPVLAASVSALLAMVTFTDAQSGQGEKTVPNGPPRIVATSPKVGETEVKPDIAEITVTFDRDMQSGFSWTGGPPDFPTGPEGQKPRWRDKRTCVLPVKLEAARYYRVGINSTSYQSFRSSEGIPAQTSAIYFTTVGASEQLKRKASRPIIVGLVPKNGANDVDPNLKELRVTFNVPMGDGCSWTGGGEQFPTIPEGKKVFWTDDHKTCVLPVELKPAWEYHLGINSPSHKNFQSSGGVPLEPAGYSFKTKTPGT